jgi:hypothetical protein
MHRVLFAIAIVWSWGGLALAENPRDNPAWSFYSLGVEAYFDRRPAEAIRQLNIAATGLDDPRVFYFRGLALHQLGQAVDAQADFARGAELERNRIDLRRLTLNETDRLSQVNSALARVQGPRRDELEQYRRNAVGAIRTAQKFKEHKLAQLRAKTERYAGGFAVPPSEKKPTYRDLSGQIVVYQGQPWRVLDLDANDEGIRAMTLLDPSVSVDPAKYAKASYLTPQGWVTGEAAMQYRVAKLARLMPAAQLGRVESKLGPLAFNPLVQALTNQETAKQGWAEFRAKEQARLRQLAETAAQRRAQEEAELARRRQLEEQRVPAASVVDAGYENSAIRGPSVWGEAPPESFAVVDEPPPSFTPQAVDWAIDRAEAWSLTGTSDGAAHGTGVDPDLAKRWELAPASESPPIDDSWQRDSGLADRWDFNQDSAVPNQSNVVERAGQRIVAAVALHILKTGLQSDEARRWAYDSDNPLERMGRGLLLSGATAAVSSGRDQQVNAAIGEVFPDLPDAAQVAMKNAITLAADGRWRKEAFVGHTAKDIVMSQLEQANPNLAGNARDAEFVVNVIGGFPAPPTDSAE